MPTAESNVNILRTKLRKAQKVISQKNKIIRQLKHEVEVLKQNKFETNSDITKYVQQCGQNNFIASQLKNSIRKGKGRRYSEHDKTVALALYYSSSINYKLLRTLVCLPCVSSLRNWLQNLDVSPGFNENILNLMQIKADKIELSERVVSIVLDEMSLKDNITYNARSDVFDGFVDFGDISESVKYPLDHANQALVILVRGLKVNFKQAIGYFVSKDGISGEILKHIVLCAIHKIMETGFVPKVVVSDQGANNLKMRSLFGINNECPFIEVNNNSIFFFHDVPHLLKSLRNNFKKYDFVTDDGHCSWRYVVDFYEKDKDRVPRLAPKLKRKCIELPPFTPMRVCFAVHVFSHSVSSGMLTHISKNTMSLDALPTAIFIGKIDKLFDIFNSGKRYVANELAHGLSDETKQLDFLLSMRDYFVNMVVCNKRGIKPHCVKGWVENISALKLLWEDLKTNFKFEYLLTRRLTQDCLENLFSVIRGKGGNNVTPDCANFKSTIRLVMTNQLLDPSEGSNCAIDASSFLLMRSELSKNVSLSISRVPYIADAGENSIIVYDDVQESSNAYVVGWLCKRLLHDECRKALTNRDKKAVCNTYIHFKEFENCEMQFPNDFAISMYEKIAYVFNSSFTEYLFQSRKQVKAKLKQCIEGQLDSDIICKECTTLFVDKCINVLIKCYLQQQNEQNGQKHVSKNPKAKKIMHE